MNAYILTDDPTPSYPSSWLVPLSKGQSVRLYNCDVCGATTSDRAVHTAWHKGLGS